MKVSSKSASIPNSLSDVPAVQAAAAVLQQTEDQRRAAEAALERLTGQLDDMDGEVGLAELANRALAGEALSTLCGDGVKLIGEIANARLALKIAERAEGLANEKVSAAMAVAFEEVVPLIRQDYTELVGRLADMLLQLTRASRDEALFRDRYSSGSLKVFQNRLPVMALPVDRERIQVWLKEAAAAGLLDAQVVREYEGLLSVRSRW